MNKKWEIRTDRAIWYKYSFKYFWNLFSGFTGIDAPFEPPEQPDLVLKAGETSVNECVHEIVDLLTENVRITDIDFNLGCLG
jgi:hypothetical protein